MCFNASYTKREKELSSILDIPEELIPELPIYYNVSGFAHPLWPLLTMETPDRIILGRWGLIPSWIKTREKAEDIRSKTLNARIETLDEKPSFRKSLQKKRCIIPVDGFFEPHHRKNKSFPYYCFSKGDNLLFLGGLYSEYDNEKTFTIITTEARGPLRAIHNKKKRMPLMILREHINKWLNPHQSWNDLREFEKRGPTEQIRSHPVSGLIYSRKEQNNVPIVREPFHYPELEDSSVLFPGME